MAAAYYKLDRLIGFLDYNGCQCCGHTDDICSLEPVEEKWRGFGWYVQRVNGHNLRQILTALDYARRTPGAPHMIIGDTIKGKGISYMENRPEWHSRPITEQDYRIAMADLEAIEQSLTEKGPE